MKIKGKKVLVTGVGGFVGSHLVEALVKRGARVRAFVHYNSRNDWGMLEDVPKNILNATEVVTGDLKDADCVREAARDQQVIFHLGALIGIPYSYVNPRDVVDTNINGTLNILTAALDFGTQKVVHTSTSEIYGTAQYVPMDEEHPVNPQSPYAASKLGADLLALSFHRSFDLPVGIIRPFNIYGPRQSARAVIPSIITQALLKGKISLGSVYPTRDLTFVRDSVKGFIDFAECEKTGGEVVNLGSSHQVSISQIANLISNCLGKKIQIEREKKRMRPEKSEVERLFSDSRKAKRLFGWHPKTDLKQGIEKTISWYEKNLRRYKADIYNI
ncbi:MAG: NAD-dependent dehydratase [candidate division Zixibacteria bacterium SM23_73_3]|nr:MAG: NAD-dependent dehydratase [candidate division Zixibacteria bacterium SM23_73_3]